VFPELLKVRTVIAEYRAQDTRITNPFLLVRDALKNDQSGGGAAVADDTYQLNISERVLEGRDFPLNILQSEATHGTMGGAAFVNSVLYAMPRYFRGEGVWGSTKGDIEMYMDLPLADAAPNMSTFFIADFGVIGGLLGGLFFGAICNAYVLLAMRSVTRNPLISLVLLGGMAYFIYNMEIDLNYTFCFLRNLIIICGGIYLLNLVMPMQVNPGAGRLMPPPRPPARPPLPVRPRPLA
jgi:hypothetical protein